MAVGNVGYVFSLKINEDNRELLYVKIYGVLAELANQWRFANEVSASPLTINNMKKKIETVKAPKATGPFSQAIIVGNLIFVGGQIHLTPEGKLLEGTMEEQAHQVMRNLQAVLEAAGVSFSNVVKTTIYVTEMSVYPKINEVYSSYFSDPFPARETVCVKELPLGAKLEISLIAVKS